MLGQPQIAGDGNVGGPVRVENSGRVYTAGDDGIGIFAQSVGGLVLGGAWAAATMALASSP